MQSLKEKLSQKSGITLIALVVTIIILIILAAVSISIVFGQNGMIARAQQAQMLQNKAMRFEEIELDITSARIEKEVDRKGEVFITVLEDIIRAKNYEWIQEILTFDGSGNEDAEPEDKNTMIIETKDGYQIVINVTNSTNEAYIDKENYLPLEESRVTITYVAVDGNAEHEVGTQEVRNGFSATLGDCSYEKTNYEFTGWSKYENGKDGENNPSITAAGGKLKIEGNTKLYAQFSQTHAVVSFNGNGATGTIEDMTVGLNTETNITGKEEAYTKEGYYFVGWSTTPGENQTVAYTNSVTVTGDMTLYAQWKQYVTVTFNANGGKFNDNSTTKTVRRRQGETINNLSSVVADPTRNAYYFQGWNTSSNATTTISSVTVGTENMTIYAVWTKATQAENAQHPEWHIPTGFTHTVGTASTGYVISDGTNEFVWIPVANSTTYTKQLGTNNWDVKNGSSGLDTASSMSNNVSNAVRGDTLGVNKILDTNVTSTLSASSPESAVVYEAGGFWVGRYEAGITSTARSGYLISSISDNWFNDSTKASTSNTFWDSKTIIVSQNAEPARLITQAEALKLANNWKSGNANETAGTVKFQSGLITGAQWDAMCKFIGWDTCNTDCSSWGNYSNVASGSYSGLRSQSNDTTWKSGLGQKGASASSVFPTGMFSGSSVSNTAKNNIYDVAGNVWEWTTEISQYNSNCAVTRGGAADSNSSNTFATARIGHEVKTTGAYFAIGFRIILYVK